MAWDATADLSPLFSMTKAQREADKQISLFLKQRGLELESGIVLLGADEPWIVFEHNKRCIGIDPGSGIWVGNLGEEWNRISPFSTVGVAAEAVEFLTGM